MLKLKTLRTGSVGNCYLLTTEKETLILDCGIGIKDIKRGLDYDLSKIKGVIVTHSHADHVKSAEDFKAMGFEVWQPYLSNKRQMEKFGSFTVQAFKVPHDDTECYGFYIKVGGHKIVYATDYEYIPVSFKKLGINHLIIECNYQKELVNAEAENRNHVLKGHAELQTVLDIVNDNNSNDLRTVLICHLSNENSQPEEMVEAIKEIVPIDVTVDYARKGLVTELRESRCPF